MAQIATATLARIGAKLVAIIIRRTNEGKDRYGRPFEPYSTRTFAMPPGATTKRAIATLTKQDRIRWFTNSKGRKWILVVGGYAALKNAEFAKAGGAGGVNLQRTGQMLRSLSVISVDSAKGTIRLGFNRTEASDRAFWNRERGREFLGVTAKELASDAEIVAALSLGVKLSPKDLPS